MWTIAEYGLFDRCVIFTTSLKIVRETPGTTNSLLRCTRPPVSGKAMFSGILALASLLGYALIGSSPGSSLMSGWGLSPAVKLVGASSTGASACKANAFAAYCTGKAHTFHIQPAPYGAQKKTSREPRRKHNLGKALYAVLDVRRLYLHYWHT
jgi:hypothetical protein